LNSSCKCSLHLIVCFLKAYYLFFVVFGMGHFVMSPLNLTMFAFQRVYGFIMFSADHLICYILDYLMLYKSEWKWVNKWEKCLTCLETYLGISKSKCVIYWVGFNVDTSMKTYLGGLVFCSANLLELFKQNLPNLSIISWTYLTIIAKIVMHSKAVAIALRKSILVGVAILL